MPGLTVFALCALLVLLLLWVLDRRRLQKDGEHWRQISSSLAAEKRDLTQREQGRQQTLFDGMAEGVLLINHAGQIEFLNLSLKRLLAIISDVRGQPLSAVLDQSELETVRQRVQNEGQMVGVELDLTKSIGRYLQVNASLFAGPDHDRRGTLFVFHDLTRVKQFESTRRDFVANVSHELRTPLTLIKGFVQTLLESGAESPQQQVQYLRTIARHTDRLTFLIEDLLTLARLEGAEAAMNVQPVALHPVVDKTLLDLQPRASERGVKLENEMPPELAARADADRLEQVLLNLVENAIKYGRDKGRVQVGGRALPHERVEVWVRDDGPGIPPESRDRVFERFYRIDRSRSRDKGGTGLGLAIVKHIVHAHGGEVWLRSDPGQGCTFCFTLPAEESSAA